MKEMIVVIRGGTRGLGFATAPASVRPGDRGGGTMPVPSQAALHLILKPRGATLVNIPDNASFLRGASPTTGGPRRRTRLKNHTFVLQLLAGSPSKGAEQLVRVVESNRGAFTEYRMVKPWTPPVGLLPVAWENVTRTAHTPKYRLKFDGACGRKI